MFDDIKKKKLYGRINITILNKIRMNFKIKIEKECDDFNLFQNNNYTIEYKLLCKCFEKVLEEQLEMVI